MTFKVNIVNNYNRFIDFKSNNNYFRCFFYINADIMSYISFYIIEGKFLNNSNSNEIDYDAIKYKGRVFFFL